MNVPSFVVKGKDRLYYIAFVDLTVIIDPSRPTMIARIRERIGSKFTSLSTSGIYSPSEFEKVLNNFPTVKKRHWGKIVEALKGYP